MSTGTAYAALYRASMLDPRIDPASNARARAWQDVLDGHDFTEAEVEHAVNLYYSEPVRHAIMPGDLVGKCREVRRRERSTSGLSDEQREAMLSAKIDLMRQEWRERRAAQGKPVDVARPLPARAQGGEGAAPASYMESGALRVPCPRCGASAWDRCVGAGTGEPAHAPCLPRIVAGLAGRAAR